MGTFKPVSFSRLKANAFCGLEKPPIAYLELDEWRETLIDMDARDAIEGRKEFIRPCIERE